MKLRNKKTGTIGELHFEPDKEYHFTIVTEDPSDVMIYKTLGEVIKDWADFIVHVPAEPLIKDEKIRKAVRAWAEAEEIEKVFLRDDLVWGEPMVRIAEDTAYHEISFKGSLKIKCGTYTITELCGEDDKWD